MVSGPSVGEYDGIRINRLRLYEPRFSIPHGIYQQESGIPVTVHGVVTQRQIH